MRHSIRRIAQPLFPLLAIVLAFLAFSSAAAHAAPLQDKDSPKGVHKESRYGFSFKQPKKCMNVAIKTDEQWLAAKYVSQASYSYTDPETGYTSNHSPELQVIVFPLEVTKKGGLQEKDEEDEDGERVKIFEITNPYRDYDDFLTRTFKGGGFYLSDEVEDEIDGVQVTKYTYTVDKLARSGPQTIETWVYRGDGVDYAVQLVGLTKHWSKIQKAFKSVRQSFELIERTGSLNHSGATSRRTFFSRIIRSDESPKERKSRAVASESSIHEAAIAKLPPDGWDAKKGKKTLVISSADKRYYKRVQKHTENMFKWMDKEFGFLGKEAYLRAPVVRVCATRDEAAAFTAGVDSGGYGGSWNISDELLTWDDTSGWTGYAVDRLNSQIYRYWMLEKNFELSSAMPRWIDNGLLQLLINCRMDKGKPDFRFQNYTVELFRTAVREGKATPIKDIFLKTSAEYREGGSFGTTFSESAMLINYLASPEVKRHPLAKGLLKRYLTNMIRVVGDADKKSSKALEEARKKADDEGEDGDKSYTNARRRIFKNKEKQILKETFDLTFGDWEESDWTKFQKAFYDAY
ncbi:MAG: hypothetical protein AAGG01_01985 [Planctomycetota bacterium]